MSTTKKTCQSCGGSLPTASRGGLCPACLMGEAIDSLDTLPDDTASPPPATSVPSGPDPLEGTTLGPDGRYKILQRIGEGGFGTVFMADQVAPVKRRVAIKILKAGMDTRQVVARFEAERQALAMMDHPNIARILDGGETEHGRPFFVMELVRGTPITQFCDEEQLPTRKRLDLFLEVCRAVQHAHQKGIIHRDLKPANILVTLEDGADPVPKVIDFGVAKALESNLTEKTLFTRFEQMIGTPAYMSPEQASSRAAQDLDTRADIYALGVLLYELLTGTTPFDAKTLQSAAFDEVRRILREEEAPRPSARLSSLEQKRCSTIAKERGTVSSSLGKQLRGELDWIVMKAIEKDRKRRYETANAFALDVEKHLENEPVSAGPPTVSYRMGKFFRRHRAGTGIAAVIFLSLLTGLGLALTGFQRARDEANKAREAEAIALQERETAQLVNDFVLQDLLGKGGAQEDILDSKLTMRDALDRASATIDERFADRPGTRAEIHALVSRAYELIGAPESALRHSQEHRELLEEEFGVQSAEALQAQAAGALTLPEKERGQILEQVLAAQRKLLGSSHPQTLRTMHSLAVHLKEEEPIRAEALAIEEIALLQKHHPEHRYDIAVSKLVLGQVLRADQQKEESTKWLEEAIADFRALGQDSAEVESMITEAQSEIELGTGTVASFEATLRTALARAIDAFGPDSIRAAKPYFQLGWQLASTSNEPAKVFEGIDLLKRALKILNRVSPATRAGRAHYEMCLKACQDRAGLYQDAIDLLRGTLKEIRASGFQGAEGKYSEKTYVHRLHSLYHRHHQVDGAEEVFRPPVEAAIKSDGFVKATSSKYFPFLLKCRFVSEGEDGLRQLLRELGELSEPPVTGAELDSHLKEGIKKGTLHSALIAGRRGDWHRTMELLKQCQDLGAALEPLSVYLGYGALLLKLDDRIAYREFVGLALERVKDSDKVGELSLTAILLLLDRATDARDQHEIAATLAQRSMQLYFQQKGPKSFNLLNCLSRGLAAVRAENWEEVQETLKGAVQYPHPKIQSPMHACLAIAAAKRGDQDRAKEHLASAEKLIGELTIWADKRPEEWIYELIAEILLEEARELVTP